MLERESYDPNVLGDVITKDYQFFPGQERLVYKGKEITLRGVQTTIYSVFANLPPNQVVPYNAFSLLIWERDMDYSTYKCIKAHVSKIRCKLEEHGKDIENIRQVGYRLRVNS